MDKTERAVARAHLAQVASVVERTIVRHSYQVRPDDDNWLTWLILAGRGAGKTRVGAEEVRIAAAAAPGQRIAVVAPTFAAARDVCIEGDSGVLAAVPDWWVARWNRSIGELVFRNGSLLKIFSAEEPARLRGPQHHFAWCDEPGAWSRPGTWHEMRLGLRLGSRPWALVTGTPSPRTDLIREIMASASTVMTTGTTMDNRANLAESAVADLLERYGGTRRGEAELYGRLLEDTDGALWTAAQIEEAHPIAPDSLISGLTSDLVRIVVGVDPAVTSADSSDETGIIAAGVTESAWCPLCGPTVSPHIFVLEDASGRMSPDVWCRRAIALADAHSADRVVAEVNNGGDLVETILRTIDPSISYQAVHASRGKRIRAEPVAALYEQRRVHHVGDLTVLEDQMTTWTPDAASSPDRLDALVWAITALVIDTPRRRRRSMAA